MAEIRKAIQEDIKKLLVFARASFIDTYAHLNTPGNMELYLKDTFTPESFQKEFEQPDSHFLILEKEGTPIGYCKVNFGKAQTEAGHHHSGEIERIYVHNDYKGQGFGKALLRAAMDLSKEHSADYLWLGVWEYNVKALRFYEKLGLKPFGTHTFQLGDDPQKDILMRINL